MALDDDIGGQLVHVQVRDVVLHGCATASADGKAGNRVDKDEQREREQLPARGPPFVLEIRNVQLDLDPVDPGPWLGLALK